MTIETIDVTSFLHIFDAAPRKSVDNLTFPFPEADVDKARVFSKQPHT